MTSDTDTDFPTTTFESVEFTGCGAIKPNFKGELKFEVDNIPQALVQLQALHTKKGKLVFVSDQGQISEGAGGNGSSTWADTSLQLDEEREVEYAACCVGGECPHFCVPKEGDLANQFVCYLDPDALMVIVEGETRCPLYVDEVDQDDAAGPDAPGYDGPDEAASTEGEESAKAARGAGVVIVLYPGDDDPHVTQVGETTLYGELVFDYFTEASVDCDDPSGFVVHGEEDGNDRDLETPIDADDYGKRLIVAEIAA